MNVLVNGTPSELPAQTTITDLLTRLGRRDHGKGLAVALNGEVVTRARWSDTKLIDDDRVEILHAIGGG